MREEEHCQDAWFVEAQQLTEDQRAAVVARFREKMASVRLKEMEVVDA